MMPQGTSPCGFYSTDRRIIMGFIETKFFVDEEKRTVVCVIETVNDISDKLLKYGFSSNIIWYKYDGKRKYVGVAKCAPEDEWDERYGRQLAEYKASRARMVDVNNEIKKFINQTSRQMDNLYDYGLLKEPHYPNEKKK